MLIWLSAFSFGGGYLACRYDSHTCFRGYGSNILLFSGIDGCSSVLNLVGDRIPGSYFEVCTDLVVGLQLGWWLPGLLVATGKTC